MSKDDITIRPAEPDDLPQVAALEERAAVFPWKRERLEKAFRQKGKFLPHVAEIDGEIKGYLLLEAGVPPLMKAEAIDFRHAEIREMLIDNLLKRVQLKARREDVVFGVQDEDTKRILEEKGFRNGVTNIGINGAPNTVEMHYGKIPDIAFGESAQQAARKFITLVAREKDTMPHWLPVTPYNSVETNIVGMPPQEGTELGSNQSEPKKFVKAMAQGVSSAFVSELDKLLKRYRPLYRHGMEEPKLFVSSYDAKRFTVSVTMEEKLQRRMASEILAEEGRQRG